MPNELDNPGFENAIVTYTGATPLPTSTGNWTAWRVTTTRQNSVFSSGAWAIKVDAPSGTGVATIIYQDLAAIAASHSYRLGFDIYIADDGEPQEVVVAYGYDHASASNGLPTRLVFTTADTTLEVGGDPTAFDGLTANTWHSILLETDVGAATQDLTIDGVFVGSATGPSDITTDAVTVFAGQPSGTVGSTSEFYFDSFLFERSTTGGGGGIAAGPPLIAVEFAAVR